MQGSFGNSPGMRSLPANVVTTDGGGKIDPSVLPAISITNTTVVANQSAMLGLTAEAGDVAIRTDFTPRKAFILVASPAATLGNWEPLNPATTVTSVNGSSGDITGLLAGSNNLSDVINAGTARSNLGLGTAATQPASAFASAIVSSSQLFSGDALLADFSWAHGLAGTPSRYLAIPTTLTAAALSYVTADATNVTIHFVASPALGTNNIGVHFQAGI